ncbi:MAG: FAD-binding dehydrogenase [Chloroflexota bacterium]
MTTQADVIIVGAGLAGLVAATELVAAGKKVLILDQEPEQSLGGQAFWSFGGLMLVDSPEQRRLGIKDSHELAWQDWLGTAKFDRDDDHYPCLWAEKYVEFASGEKREWLTNQGMTFFPIVGWAERGGYGAIGHGNSVPRFHIVWGTGPGILEPFISRVREGESRGLVTFKFRHRVNEVLTDGGIVTGVSGEVLEPSSVERGAKSSRTAISDFSFTAQAVMVTSGGIGGNLDLIRKNWASDMGNPPKKMLYGVPDYVDGRMLAITESVGGNIINRDRMWHYTEGIENYAPIWTKHGIRILPGPSSMWFDAEGNRLPVPLFPGFDNRASLKHISLTGYDYSWFILTQKIIEKEFALSGSEQNPDLTGKSWAQVAKRVLPGAPPPVERFKQQGKDFVIADNLDALVRGMNALTEEPLLEFKHIQDEIKARDNELHNKFSKDMQIVAIRGSQNYIGDKLIRTAKLHRLLDTSAGPLIAVKLNLLTRKTLGGLQTNLDGQVLGTDGNPVQGLYAAGEVAGFGGGGMHGYAALEGTFLGGCIFSGRTAGRAVAGAIT